MSNQAADSPHFQPQGGERQNLWQIIGLLIATDPFYGQMRAQALSN